MALDPSHEAGCCAGSCAQQITCGQGACVTTCPAGKLGFVGHLVGNLPLQADVACAVQWTWLTKAYLLAHECNAGSTLFLSSFYWLILYNGVRA